MVIERQTDRKRRKDDIGTEGQRKRGAVRQRERETERERERGTG
jgi:hypothetical protein